MTRCEKMEENYRNIKNLRINVGRVSVNAHIPFIKKKKIMFTLLMCVNNLFALTCENVKEFQLHLHSLV
jgi:hypothetical protein